MTLSKSWLIAAIIIALLYLLFPRYKIQTINYSYPATNTSRIIKEADGGALVFRFDRWTGKVSVASGNAYKPIWRIIETP